MTRYVVNGTVPPAGADFGFVVPGNYLWDVVGVTAQLNTAQPLVHARDISGHVKTGTYYFNGGFPTAHAGLIAGGGAIQTGNLAALSFTGGYTFPDLGYDVTGDFSVEFTMTVPNPNPNSGSIITWTNTAPSRRITFGIRTDFDFGFLREQIASDEIYHWTLAGIVDDNLPHTYDFVYAASVASLYVDGVLIPPASATAPIVMTSFTRVGTALGRVVPSPGQNCIAEAISIFAFGLTGGQVAAHVAALAGGWVTYMTAVLADLPAAFWPLDDGGGGGREPSLVVSDGTTELVAIPPGFPAVATPGPYQYSWQPDLNADTQSSDGTLTTVAIPRMLLKPGHTIGVRTPDIQPGDRWSKVVLWWDDNFQNAMSNPDPFIYAPGALLVITPPGG